MPTRSDSANDAGRISRGPVASPRPSERGMGAQNRGVKSENVRASNMSTVLRNILASPGEVTREAAAAHRPVWVGVSDRTGRTSVRLVEPVTVEGGMVTALDAASGQVRTLSVHRVTGVAPA